MRGLVEQFGELRDEIDQPAADDLNALKSKQVNRGAIGGTDAAVVIETHDAGANAPEHSLDKRTSVFRIFLRRHQIAPLRLELRRHFVEGAGQRVDFVALFADRNARLQIAGRNATRGANEPPNWLRHARGAGQPDPTGSQKQQQSGREISHPK